MMWWSCFTSRFLTGQVLKGYPSPSSGQCISLCISSALLPSSPFQCYSGVGVILLHCAGEQTLVASAVAINRGWLPLCIGPADVMNAVPPSFLFTHKDTDSHHKMIRSPDCFS